MAPKKTRLLVWVDGEAHGVTEVRSLTDGFTLADAVNTNGVPAKVVLDPDGRNIGQGDTGTIALAAAIKKPYLGKGHAKILRAIKKGFTESV